MRYPLQALSDLHCSTHEFRLYRYNRKY